MEISTDETLNIGKDASLTVPKGTTLNNNGTINNDGTIINKGTLNGDVSGSGTIESIPEIKTTIMKDGTVGSEYSQKLEAEGNNISWSIERGKIPDGLTLSNNGTISGTPTNAGTYSFTAKAENKAGSASQEFSLTINPTTYNVIVEESANGKATASENSATEGTEITLTATPNSGCHLVRWEVTQGNVTIKDNKFTMPAEPVTVKAIFERNSSGGGTVTPPSPTHTEIIGKDRYETAALIADKIGYYDTAVLVNAENTMSDGLSASALSGKYNAPILLTKKDSIPDSTVKRLKKASTIYIIGGENAISENVEKELSGKKVIRIGGSNRYETSELIAEHIGNYDRAFIVNGLEGEADAMSASVVSSKYNAPIILTNGKNSDYDQKSDTKYYAIGGEEVLSDSIVSEYNAERISGDDRYETSREVIEKFYSSSSKYYFTNGNTLVDALSASLPAKNYGIVLVSSKSDNSVLEDKNTVQVGGMDFEISAK
ncbi:cell wall-binding repeat-containing protein [Peptacetobacter hominis]|uniref:cell wall-binding repeat-containing protein n=1 Tax=Peptacetobacter hominis TaxID=2743610 RepID=UPI0015840575|nr:cell wall-binding repeat-containing protein [Peptacetobacter hominis]